MSTYLRTIFVLTVLISLSVAAGATGASPTIIRFSHVVSEDSPKGQMALRFKQLVEERMEGKYVVEVYPNSQLFDDSQVFEALLLDDIQLAAPSASKFTKYSKRLQIFDLPFLFKDMEAARRFQQTLEGNYLLFNFLDRGILGLGYLNNGLKQMSATKKLEMPADAEGLKFRIMDSEVLKLQFSALKAESVPTSFSQVYPLLASGSLDGQENTWSNMYAKKLHTVQPYILESNHGLNTYIVATSANFWNSLSAEDRGELNTIIKEAIDYGEQLASDQEMQDRQKIIDSRAAEVISLNPAQRTRWVEAMKPVWNRFNADIEQELIDLAVSCNQ